MSNQIDQAGPPQGDDREKLNPVTELGECIDHAAVITGEPLKASGRDLFFADRTLELEEPLPGEVELHVVYSHPEGSAPYPGMPKDVSVIEHRRIQLNADVDTLLELNLGIYWGVSAPWSDDTDVAPIDPSTADVGRWETLDCYRLGANFKAIEEVAVTPELLERFVSARLHELGYQSVEQAKAAINPSDEAFWLLHALELASNVTEERTMGSTDINPQPLEVETAQANQMQGSEINEIHRLRKLLALLASQR